MQIFVVSAISAVLAGMGIGGGALFVMLGTLFLNYEQKMAQFINLIMFIAVGISSSVRNFKDKKIEKNILIKVIPLIILGCLFGTFLLEKIENEKLRVYFSVFMVCIGIYEIITSVIKIKKAKNNCKT